MTTKRIKRYFFRWSIPFSTSNFPCGSLFIKESYRRRSPARWNPCCIFTPALSIAPAMMTAAMMIAAAMIIRPIKFWYSFILIPPVDGLRCYFKKMISRSVAAVNTFQVCRNNKRYLVSFPSICCVIQYICIL